MHSVGLHRFGPPDVLELIAVPIPEPGPGQVRVKVVAAGVNPTDLLLRSGQQRQRLADRPPPYLLGREFSGVIDAVADGVPWSEGDQVFGVADAHAGHGAQAEYVVVDQTGIARCPAGLSLLEAATLPLNGLTALACTDFLRPTTGDTVFVSGASGAVGGHVVSLCAAAGATAIVDAFARDEDLVRSLGAGIVVERGPGWLAELRRARPDGVDGVADAGLLQRAALSAVRDGGRFAALRASVEWETERGIDLRRINVNTLERVDERLREVADLTKAEVLVPRIAAVLPADRASDAHRMMEEGGVRGRILLEFA